MIWLVFIAHAHIIRVQMPDMMTCRSVGAFYAAKLGATEYHCMLEKTA